MEHKRVPRLEDEAAKFEKQRADALAEIKSNTKGSLILRLRRDHDLYRLLKKICKITANGTSVGEVSDAIDSLRSA